MTKTINEDRLKTLGFGHAAEQLKALRERKRKLALAYEHFKFVRPEKILLFNERLKAKTKKGEEPFNATWQTLEFTPISVYSDSPPTEVLDKLEEAIALKCFDRFEIARIRNVRDPLLFGRIDKCEDRFFIAQWDDDIKITDILKENEG